MLRKLFILQIYLETVFFALINLFSTLIFMFGKIEKIFWIERKTSLHNYDWLLKQFHINPQNYI